MIAQTFSSAGATTPRANELRLADELCEALRVEAFNGLKALPRRGAEVGGILTLSAGENGTFQITGYELIPCEHLYGPSYRLSSTDMERFYSRCEELREGGAIKIVGLFRSSTRDGFHIASEDISLVSKVLPDPPVVVLIKPSLTGSAIFRLLRPKENTNDWLTFSEFEARNQLIALPSGLGASAALSPCQKATWQPADHAVRETVMPELHFETGAAVASLRPSPVRRSNKKWVTYYCAFGAFALFAGALIVARSPQPAPPKLSINSLPNLDMQLLPQGESVRLTWNRNLDSIRKSAGGTLLIRDGPQDREIALDSSQIALAAIYYKPSFDDVTFRLKVFGHEPEPLTGIARILNARKAANIPETDIETVRAVIQQPNAAAPPAQQSKETSRSQPVQSTASRMLPALSSKNRETVSSAKNERNVPKEASISPVLSQPDNENLPRSAEAVPQNLRESKVDRPPQFPAGGEPVIPVILQSDSSPVVSAANLPLASPFSVPGSAAAADLPVPGSPLKQVLPARHLSGAPAILSPVTVTVQVSIDKQGAVIEAHALPGGSPFWSLKAVEAAKQWRYKPSMLHGQSIESISTIVFRFTP